MDEEELYQIYQDAKVNFTGCLMEVGIVLLVGFVLWIAYMVLASL